ncbi:hypothetical protein L6452_26490 [Arctium lappa]|uniref:Uncharacterized protein n=1 Tax=Arctium lappa TaxID=4217 RepID=A0ACB8ZV42_ARCLA|nr:hypothetical protein L6452_26490 [Arctium lappa]
MGSQSHFYAMISYNSALQNHIKASTSLTMLCHRKLQFFGSSYCNYNFPFQILISVFRKREGCKQFVKHSPKNS